MWFWVWLVDWLSLLNPRPSRHLFLFTWLMRNLNLLWSSTQIHISIHRFTFSPYGTRESISAYYQIRPNWFLVSTIHNIQSWLWSPSVMQSSNSPKSKTIQYLWGGILSILRYIIMLGRLPQKFSTWSHRLSGKALPLSPIHKIIGRHHRITKITNGTQFTKGLGQKHNDWF